MIIFTSFSQEFETIANITIVGQAVPNYKYSENPHTMLTFSRHDTHHCLREPESINRKHMV